LLLLLLLYSYIGRMMKLLQLYIIFIYSCVWLLQNFNLWSLSSLWLINLVECIKMRRIKFILSMFTFLFVSSIFHSSIWMLWAKFGSMQQRKKSFLKLLWEHGCHFILVNTITRRKTCLMQLLKNQLHVFNDSRMTKFWKINKKFNVDWLYSMERADMSSSEVKITSYLHWWTLIQ